MVQFYEPVVICKLCGDHGHSKISCPYTKALDEANISEEDAVFWSYVHPEDRPESLRGGDWSDNEEEDREHHNPGVESQDLLNPEPLHSDQESSAAAESDESPESEQDSVSDESSPDESDFEH